MEATAEQQSIISQPETAERTQPVPQSELTHKQTSSKLPVTIGIVAVILVLMVGAYYVKKHTVKRMPVAMKVTSKISTVQTSSSASNETPTPVSTSSALTVDMNTNHWKTYSNAKYSLKYPINWFIYEEPKSTLYTGQSFFIYISEVSDPYNMAKYFGHKNHQVFQMFFSSDKMPINYPYTGGDTRINPTIKSVIVNGYTGIRGNSTEEGYIGAWDKQETLTSVADQVDLADPKGGYIEVTNDQGNNQIFNLILDSFRFN